MAAEEPAGVPALARFSVERRAAFKVLRYSTAPMRAAYAADGLNASVLRTRGRPARSRTMGVIYKTSGDMERALADLNEALRVNPGYALALCNRGWVKLAIGDLTGRADIEKAKQLDPAQVERFCRSRSPARPQ
jgi:tetratricopeptide (TPR) repeat protein